MSEKYSIEFPLPQSGGHPHDLLARLYREIGLSAVAAALEVSQLPDGPERTAVDARSAWVPLGENLAA